MRIPIETDIANQRVIISSAREHKKAAVKRMPHYQRVLDRVYAEYPDCDVPVCMDVVVRRAKLKWSQYMLAADVATIVADANATIKDCEERLVFLERALTDQEARSMYDLGY